MRPGTAAERERLLARLRARSGPEPGLCSTCRHFETIESPRSVFVRCGLARDDPRFPRYPALPVDECPGWSRDDEDGGATG